MRILLKPGSKLIFKQVEDFLEQYDVLHLGTTDGNHLRSVALFYVNEGKILYFISKKESQHAQHIATYRSVAFSIAGKHQPIHLIQGVQGEGEAVALPVLEPRILEKYLQKFPEAKTILQSEDASLYAWYQIIPKKIIWIDNSQGFGYKEELLNGELS